MHILRVVAYFKRNDRSITKESELIGMKKISEVVGTILKLMTEYAKVGMSTKELDKYDGEILKRLGAKSTYAVELMDGWTLVGNKVGYFTQHE